MPRGLLWGVIAAAMRVGMIRPGAAPGQLKEFSEAEPTYPPTLSEVSPHEPIARGPHSPARLAALAVLPSRLHQFLTSAS